MFTVTYQILIKYSHAVIKRLNAAPGKPSGQFNPLWLSGATSRLVQHWQENGLLPDGTTSFPEPMLTNNQRLLVVPLTGDAQEIST